MAAKGEGDALRRSPFEADELKRYGDHHRHRKEGRCLGVFRERELVCDVVRRDENGRSCGPCESRSIGAGLRFLASQKYGVNVSLDYAIGRDTRAFYFYIGEAF